MSFLITGLGGNALVALGFDESAGAPVLARACLDIDGPHADISLSHPSAMTITSAAASLSFASALAAFALTGPRADLSFRTLGCP